MGVGQKVVIITFPALQSLVVKVPNKGFDNSASWW